MLETTLKFQKAFERLEEENGYYLSYFREDDGGRLRGGPPSSIDWSNASIFVMFLRSFYNVTLKFSTSLNVSSHVYLHEICTLQAQLNEWSISGDYLLGDMAAKMLKKFDKYWGKLKNINQMLLIAIVLDPRYKLDYVEHCFGFIYHDDEIASSMTKSLKTNLMCIYDWYVSGEVTFESSQLSTDVDSKTSDSDVGSNSISTSSATSSLILGFKKKRAAKDCIEIKNDVEKYLLES